MSPPPPLTLLDASSLAPDALLSRLTAGERSRLEAFPARKRRDDWLLGRAAAKEAVREALARLGGERPDWQAFEVGSGANGAPAVRLLRGGPPLAVSLSHGHGRAAAWALPTGVAGGLPGVDLERVRVRPPGTLRFYLHRGERAWVEALAPESAPGQEDASPRDLAAVLLWALKEAAFKALQPPRGTGLLDVEVALTSPYDAERGAAEVSYRGAAAERAARLGARAARAGWTRAGALILAWTLAEGAALPREAP